MIVQGRVIGMISIQSLEQEHAFDQGHVELLSAVANQAAVAIENARLYQETRRLYQEARGEAIAAKQLATLGTAMAALRHRINNTFNVIVPNVTRLRKRVDASDARLLKFLISSSGTPVTRRTSSRGFKNHCGKRRFRM